MSDLAQGETAMADAGAQVDVALPDIPPSVRRRAAVAKRTNPPFIYWRERCARLPALCTAAIALEARHGHLFHFVPVCLGAGAAVWFALSAPPPATVIACILTALLADICFQTAPATARHAMLCAATLTCAGMLLAEWETRRAATTMLDQPVVTIVTGVVERREAGASGEWRYVMRLTGTLEPTLRRPPQRISVLARSRHEPLAIGTLASGRARLSPPSGPALPGMNDFAFASYFSGIGAVGFFLGPPVAFTLPPVAPSGMGQLWLEFLPKSWGEFWLTADQSLFALRDQISIRIRTVVSGDPGAFAASIITGERRSMSEGATEALRLSGLAHITAISGLNMALAAGIFFVGLRAGLSLFPVLAQTYPVKKIAAAGAVVIDNSSTWRMDPDVPLIVPEVNADAVAGFTKKGIIANPNCSTAQLVVALKPLHDAATITRVVVSTYQSVSGAGKDAMDELWQQTKGKYVPGQELEPKKFPKQIAFNCIPHIDVFMEDGYTKEEWKMLAETKKILDPKIKLTATCVRVPVFVGHSEAVNIEFAKPITPEEARDILRASPGIMVIDKREPGGYITPVEAAGEYATFVSRIREDATVENGLTMWIVSDNLLKGAALNAVQIAETIVNQRLLPQKAA